MGIFLNARLGLKLTIFFFLLGPLFGANALSESKRGKITWLEIDYPPAYIFDGPNSGEGFGQVGLNYFVKNMPSYEHKKMTVNISRLLLMMKDKSKIYCAPQLGVYVNQFKDTIYSKAALVVPPAGIAILKKDISKFKKLGESVSFEKLLKDRSLNLGVLGGGQFGDRIDRLIAKNKNESNIHYRYASTNQLNHYKMLLSDRIDYIVDYPFSYSEVLNQLSDEKREKLKFLSVEEEMQPKKAYAVCNDSLASEAVLAKINSIVRMKGYKDAVSESLFRFIPSSLHDEYRGYIYSEVGE